MPVQSLYEIQLGVYATQDGLHQLVEGCRRVLAGRLSRYELEVADEGRMTEPDGMPLAEFYEELPQQWRIEQRGADPGSRKVYEIRAGVCSSHSEVDVLRAELTRVACPDSEHSGPCPIPWSAGYTEVRSEDEQEWAYLEQRYGHLRG